MTPDKVERVPPEAYIASARSHVASANDLSRSGRHNHAVFHLITAMEELASAYIEQVAESGDSKGLKWDGKPVLGGVSGARKDHDFKVPTGMLLVAQRARKLYDAEIQLVSPTVPPEARAKLVAKLADEMAWVAGLFGTVDGVRELSIYAGWYRPDISRPVVDWERVAGILAPVVDRELVWQEFLLQHPLGPKERSEARAAFEELAKKREEGAK